MPGKVLSNKNVTILQQILKDTAGLLVSAGFDNQAISELLKESETTLMAAEQGFKDLAHCEIWYQNNRTILNLIQDKFCEIGGWSEEPAEQRIQDMNSCLLDFEQLMSESIKNMPPIDGEEAYFPMYCSGSSQGLKRLQAKRSFSEQFKRSCWFEAIDTACCMFRNRLDDLMHYCNLSRENCIQQAGELLQEFCAILREQIQVSPCCFEESSTVQASGQSNLKITNADANGHKRETITLACSQLQADATKLDLNQQPFSGVLLRVEEISCGQPQVGPGGKLYVSRQAAQAACDIINASGGLPLDVKDDLSGHQNNNIVGTMTSAAIVGQDLLVKGHLFPFNKPEETTQIARHINDLGMSINAETAFHTVLMRNPTTNVDETVAYIDELYPLGANILYSKLATWTNTKVIQASGTKPIPENQPKNIMNDNQNITDLLTQFISAQQETTERIEQKVDTSLAKIQAELEQNKQELALIKAEKSAQLAAEQERLAQEQKAKDNETLAQTLAAALGKVVNPSGQPISLTANDVTPLVAGASSPTAVNTISNGIERDLIAAQARLDLMTEQSTTGPERIKQVGVVNRLKSQLTQHQLNGVSA